LKLLVTLVLVGILIWFAYRRLRPYLQLARRVFSTLRGTLEVAAHPPGESGPDRRSNRLVRCQICETWVPANRAFLIESLAYCSHACLDKAPPVRHKKAAS